MLQLYGNPRSRAMRCLRMLEEVGKPYQLVEKTTRETICRPQILRLNPNARIPTLVDGDLVLWESMAINLHLAQKYYGPMHCAGPEVLGLARSGASGRCWRLNTCCSILWSTAHCWRNLRAIPGDRADELLPRKPLGVLNDALAARGHLAGTALQSPTLTSRTSSAGRDGANGLIGLPWS